ncbi:MAG: hypothetical protein AAGB04_22540 [Pseudomonadota bacterium]
MLENAKLTWFVLKRLESAGENGLSLGQLVKHCEAQGNEQFGSEASFDASAALFLVLCNLIRLDRIKVDQDDSGQPRIRPTQAGVKYLRTQNDTLGPRKH